MTVERPDGPSTHQSAREGHLARVVRGLVAPRPPEDAVSTAIVVTVVRMTIAMGFFITAIRTGSPAYNFIGLGVHWLGDLADGFLARTLKQETVLGAEIDIIADRVDVLFFFVIFLGFHPDLYLPVALYVLNFAFVDFYLSYQFDKYGIISPNYFNAVDERVYRLNYSPAGKFVNGVPVPLLLIFLPQAYLVAAAMAVTLIGVKAYSIVRLRAVAGRAPRGR